MTAAVGASVKRKDGIGKANGTARYADDLTFPGMLHARTIRSTVAKGKLDGWRLETDPTGLTIVDYRDIPGRNLVALIVDDQPCLVEREIRHAAEPVLLVAHEHREALLGARFTLDEVAEEALFDPLISSAVFKEILIEKGQLDRGFAQADLVVEGEYRTGHQEHIYIETNAVIAVPEDGGITVHGSIQCPYYVHKALTVLLGSAVRFVRVVQTETGGGFGGKEEYPSMIAGHAALLALKSGRPVKLVYDRAEDMVATTKRHPAIVLHRTGVRRDGRITAMDIEVIMDGGAYITLSPVVLSRGTLHATGPYRCNHVRIASRAMFTNTPPNGAFRGFGAPQTEFAAEVHIERIAEALGLDPAKVRAKNLFRPGDTTATGQVLGEDTTIREAMRAALRKSGYNRKRRAWAGTNRGIGLALYWHGSGFTGSGELKLGSRATVELTPTGARVLTSSTEIGQGTRTMHAQIVADALHIPYEDVEVAMPDTSVVPDSGPTVASRTCMVVGKILERAAHEIRDRLGPLTPAQYFERHGPLSVTKQYEQPDWIQWDEVAYRGDAYATYAWGCDVAEVEIDRDTWEVKPTRITVVADVGKAIHPAMTRGQLEGGTGQGVGYALLEHVVMKDGRMANAQLTNYLIPTTLDTPRMDVTILEHPYPGGPFGAKGLGELPIDGPAPAIVNAIRHLGIDARSIPALPEQVMEAACAST
jgi:CO/xanthine dehydrogenase Mo-binding subunit